MLLDMQENHPADDSFDRDRRAHKKRRAEEIAENGRSEKDSSRNNNDDHDFCSSDLSPVQLRSHRSPPLNKKPRVTTGSVSPILEGHNGFGPSFQTPLLPSLMSAPMSAPTSDPGASNPAGNALEQAEASCDESEPIHLSEIDQDVNNAKSLRTLLEQQHQYNDPFQPLPVSMQHSYNPSYFPGTLAPLTSLNAEASHTTATETRELLLSSLRSQKFLFNMDNYDFQSSSSDMDNPPTMPSSLDTALLHSASSSFKQQMASSAVPYFYSNNPVAAQRQGQRGNSNNDHAPMSSSLMCRSNPMPQSNPATLQTALASSYASANQLARRVPSSILRLPQHISFQHQLQSNIAATGAMTEVQQQSHCNFEFGMNHQQQRRELNINQATQAAIAKPTTTYDLPPRHDGPLAHFGARFTFKLATEEDLNWLSDFLYYIRTDVIEVFRAGSQDVSSRAANKTIKEGQVGIRCRFCAHLPKRQRISRSACFPSSTKKIYQSVTMMVRDHLSRCTSFPQDVREKFDRLRKMQSQGVTDSKKYWASSALKLGMIDTEGKGIVITSTSRKAATLSKVQENAVASFSSSVENVNYAPLLENSDQIVTSQYTLLLLRQIQRVFMKDEDKVGNRRSMKDDYPGFGCRYCNCANRKGYCRFFPGRRRTLPMKLQDLHDHLMKCSLCPAEIKTRLAQLKRSGDEIRHPETQSQKEFLDRFWFRLHSKVAMSYW